MDLNLQSLYRLLDRCLEEDIGPGDITTNSVVPPELKTTAFIKARQDGVVAGLPVARAVFKLLDPELDFTLLVAEGAQVTAGTVLARLEGRARTILTGERLALNFLQRLSGVATLTNRLVRLAGDYPVRLVDTRKTTPGLRMLEKYAVRVGGGHNHRRGLFDAVLIKDNHIQAAGGITPAVKRARMSVPHTVTIEVEVEDLAGVSEALEAGADIIMLDNMSTENMTRAVELVKGRALTEASGGITADNLTSVAATGVDVISMGALTHSAPALDISLDLGRLKVAPGAKET